MAFRDLVIRIAPKKAQRALEIEVSTTVVKNRGVVETSRLSESVPLPTAASKHATPPRNKRSERRGIVRKTCERCFHDVNLKMLPI